MSRPATDLSENLLPRLSPFDSAFIQTVLEHRGAGYQPSLAEFTAAAALLQRYYEQCLDNPGEAGAWLPQVDEASLVALRAKAFVMFQATKPTPAQWQKAHAALFGPLLCETCG
ncbi:MAG: hypothetical protein ABW278_11345 [Steroidobacteraceae bacterium]